MAMFSFLVILASSQLLVLVNAVPASEAEVDVKEIMKKCNESNPIDAEYLDQLNMTGSFPDENVRSAKCFIRCVFMETGVMDSDGKLVAAKLKEAFGKRQGPVAVKTADLEMFVDNCIAADADVTCQCERAYRFSKCLMTEEILKYGDPSKLSGKRDEGGY
ncbi:general odorant-binding protein 84a-like isoform X2 [Zootermopsis nevadensis]|uniref:general odorant-binding protein 84a-like isoform X2 n=1 Tax=Zootermopsis nevadensis TaxID=136037 RepID=UPI000B8EC9DC|nr:general odorant-binding protein 84a-like isoform X2 [Zootermopsis nevadensis]